VPVTIEFVPWLMRPLSLVVLICWKLKRDTSWPVTGIPDPFSIREALLSIAIATQRHLRRASSGLAARNKLNRGRKT